MTLPALETAAPAVASLPARAPGRRIVALDVLRGLAILGTMLTNIWLFAPGSPVSGQGDGVPSGSGESWFTQVAQTVLPLITDGKWIGLLTIMFGIGLEIQRQSAVRRGDAWPGTYPWRAAILILDGLLNYIFVFEFDVLMGYGLTGLAVCFIMATSPKAQKVWMVIGVTAHVLVMTAMGGALDRLMGDPSERIGSGEEAGTVGTYGVAGGPAALEATRDAAHDAAHAAADLSGPTVGNSYWEMVQARVQDFWVGRGEIPIMFFMGLGLFLVGAHLYRSGLFLPEGARLRRRVMLLSFGLGLPIDVWARLSEDTMAGGFTRYGTSTLVAFGVLAAVAHGYAHRSQVGRLGRPFQLVGRMALTNYILHNVMLSLIFHSYAFGLADRLPAHSFWLVLGVWLVVAAFLVTFSWVWLRRFERGPVEWLWHVMHHAIVSRLPRRLGGIRPTGRQPTTT